MNALATYFLNTLAFNVAMSVITFAAVWASRRKGRELTFLRGTAVLLIGWIIGSILVFIVHLLFSIGGQRSTTMSSIPGDGPLEGPISILVLILVMYAIHGWLSKKRAVVVP